jgi:hypothetical protein
MGPQKHFDIAIAYYKTDDLVLLKESAPVRKADYHNEPQEWMRMARESRAGKHGGIVILNLVMTEHDWDGKSVVGLEPRVAFVEAEVDVDFVDMVAVRTYGSPDDSKMTTLTAYGKNLIGQITKPSSKSYLTFTPPPHREIVQIDTQKDYRLLDDLRSREITDPRKLNLVPAVDDKERLKIAVGRDKPAIDAQLNVHDIEAAIDDALKQSAKIKRTVVRAVEIIICAMTKNAMALFAQAKLLTSDQYQQVYEGSDAWVTPDIISHSGSLTEAWLKRRASDETILISHGAEVREDVIWPLMTSEERELANILQALYELQRVQVTRADLARTKEEVKRNILRAQLEREAFCEDNAKLIQQAHARFHAEFFKPTKAQLTRFNELKVDNRKIGHALSARWHDAHAELAAAVRQIAIKTLVLRVFSNRVIRMIINKLSDLYAYELDPLSPTEKAEIAELKDDENETIAAYEKDAKFPEMIKDIPNTPNVNVPDPATKTVTFPLPTTNASEDLLKWFEEDLKDLAPASVTPTPSPSPAEPTIAVIPAPPPLPATPTRPASPVTRAPSPPPTSSSAPPASTVTPVTLAAPIIPPIPGTPSPSTTASTTSTTTSIVSGAPSARPEMTNSVLEGLFY